LVHPYRHHSANRRTTVGPTSSNTLATAAALASGGGTILSSEAFAFLELFQPLLNLITAQTAILRENTYPIGGLIFNFNRLQLPPKWGEHERGC
jgi:hypothetical protein